jgi:hypothetical protein
MSDPVPLNGSTENYDNMTAREFEERLPDLFQTGGGKVTEDPRFATFLERNPDCAALVRDLETIAETARKLFEPTEDQGPSDDLWAKIAKELPAQPDSLEEPSGKLE